MNGGTCLTDHCFCNRQSRQHYVHPNPTPNFCKQSGSNEVSNDPSRSVGGNVEAISQSFDCYDGPSLVDNLVHNAASD